MNDKPSSDTRFAWIPALGWIRAYTAQNVRVDLIAGLSLAAFVIPESLAYASLAQLPPVTGLYCYLVAGIAYALFGTSRQLAVGPTSSLAIVLATSVVSLADGDVARAMRCEARTLDDIRALGGNDIADERRFATAARVSEINLSLYRTFAQPFVRAMVSNPLADWMREMHPLRLQYELFSDQNPAMAQVARLAEQVRENRKQVASDNPLIAMQEQFSNQIVAGLEAWREASEKIAERTFLAVYGSPTLQAAVGVDPAGTQPLRKAPKNPLHRELLQKRIAELKSQISAGGLRAAVIRGIVYAGVSRGGVDERGFEMARRLREEHDCIERDDLR